MAMQTRKRQELLEKAKENIIRAQQQQREVYNRKHYSPVVYKLGSVVLKKDFSRKKRKGGKLDEKWLGPFTIVGMLGRGLYRLQAVDTTDIIPRVNGVHLKPYLTRSQYIILLT